MGPLQVRVAQLAGLSLSCLIALLAKLARRGSPFRAAYFVVGSGTKGMSRRSSSARRRAIRPITSRR
jgi:argininosuccinate lyase